MPQNIYWLPVVVLFGLASALGACTPMSGTPVGQTATIEWDRSSQQILSDPESEVYNGYPRMAQLQDRSLFVVYFDLENGIVGRTSKDRGLTWSGPFLILPNSATHNMDNPEVVQLSDGSLLVSTNLRPRAGTANQNESDRYQIGVIKSVDQGQTWSDLKIVYSASWQFRNGCWEPKAIQLPSGEVQLYFATEAPYTHSDEQNISMLTSSDLGDTWTTEPVIVSFRGSHRDGMPAPLILKNGTDLVLPIEDNGYSPAFTFKISLIRGSATGGWGAPIAGDDPGREYALEGVLPTSGPYAGAPYLAQLPDGETVLSFQSPLDREVVQGAEELSYSVPYVVVGDASAQSFGGLSQPFDIPEGKNGLWNSVAALDNGDIIVLTSTNGFSENGSTQVWMIRGRRK
jgi:hypothetical protein